MASKSTKLVTFPEDPTEVFEFHAQLGEGYVVGACDSRSFAGDAENVVHQLNINI